MFGALNEKLFAAFFSAGRNIGDDSVLRSLAEESGVPPATVERAWSDPAYEERLRMNHAIAVQLGITGVPTYLIGNRIVVGAVPASTLLAAARETRTVAP